ncbi:hypothetical protein D3C76_952850 [compost metagenome]
MWRDPQFDVLVIGFGAEVEATLTQLLFDVGHGQRWLAGAFEDHAFAADFHAPFGGMAGGAQDQRLEVRIGARGAGALDAVQRFHVELVFAVTRNDAPTYIGKQLALGIGETRGLLQDAGATRIVDHVTALFTARLEQQFAVGSAQLALHAGLPDVGGTFTRTVEQLAGCEQGEQGNND